MLSPPHLLLLRMCLHVQLRFLVQWGLGDVEDASQHAGPFQLLRGVITRQIVVPEVYDVMQKVQELMVCAQVLPPRSSAPCLCPDALSLHPHAGPSSLHLPWASLVVPAYHRLQANMTGYVMDVIWLSCESSIGMAWCACSAAACTPVCWLQHPECRVHMAGRA